MHSTGQSRRFGIVIVAILLIIVCSSYAGETARYWVFLRDKGIPAAQLQQALDETASNLTPQARERRIREMPALVDEYDLPVSSGYVSEIGATGVRVRRVSRWLNAVSVEATEAQAAQLRSLGCVKSVERFRLRAVAPPLPQRNLDDLNYGESLVQNELCRIPELHNRGLSGQGILMCMLDTGARLDHTAFDSLDVMATFDFIYGDTNVANEPEQDSLWQHYHGTGVLSAMAGYDDSLLIGPAYGATLLVAKTEWAADETQAEEDNYVAGMEWADSLGARITSSSLGYIGDPPDFRYDFSELDGQTATTTRALQVAAAHGILCVTAAGNENGSEWNHILTPADADSILAVGAVSNEGTIVGFSSRGPTGDGRIKPEVCAMGADVFCANADSTNGYQLWSGTSLATPIVAGIAALIMEANPDWTAQMVREAMMNTASQHNTPNNDYGWGIVDAVEAADYEFENASDQPSEVPRSAVLMSSYPNPVNGIVTVQLVLPGETSGTLKLFDTLGRQVYAWTKSEWTTGVNSVRLDVDMLATGVYTAEFEGEAGGAVSRVVVLK